jgi:hypothetical protein
LMRAFAPFAPPLPALRIAPRHVPAHSTSLVFPGLSRGAARFAWDQSPFRARSPSRRRQPPTAPLRRGASQRVNVPTSVRPRGARPPKLAQRYRAPRAPIERFHEGDAGGNARERIGPCRRSPRKSSSARRSRSHRSPMATAEAPASCPPLPLPPSAAARRGASAACPKT